jgi:hypothetical protein
MYLTSAWPPEKGFARDTRCASPLIAHAAVNSKLNSDAFMVMSAANALADTIPVTGCYRQLVNRRTLHLNSCIFRLCCTANFCVRIRLLGSSRRLPCHGHL